MKHVIRLVALVALTPVPALAQHASQPDHAAIKAAVEKLQKAQAGKDATAKLTAIRESASVDADEVAKRIGHSLTDKEFDVREAALHALRYMKSKGALDALLRAKSKLTKDVELQDDYYLALGQHGGAKALRVLADHAWDYRQRKLLPTRVAAIAHIRSVEALQALIEIENKVSRGRRSRSQVVPGIELLVGVPFPKKKGKGGPEVAQWWQMVRSVKSIEPEPQGLSDKDLAKYRRRWAAPGSEPAKKQGDRHKKRKDDKGDKAG